MPSPLNRAREAHDQSSLSALEAMSYACEVSRTARRRLETIADTMNRLDLMPRIADELANLGQIIEEAVEDARAADSRRVKAELDRHEAVIGETLTALVRGTGPGAPDED